MMKRETILAEKRIVNKMDYHATKQTINTLIDSHLEALDAIEKLLEELHEDPRGEEVPEVVEVERAMARNGWVKARDEQENSWSKRAVQWRKRRRAVIDLSFLPNGALDKATMVWGTQDRQFADGNVSQVLEWSRWS